MAIYIKTNKGDYKERVNNLYKECTPSQIIKDFNLESFKYYDSAKYGHFVIFNFPWEK
jgi:S-adenosylmethionine synthetase